MNSAPGLDDGLPLVDEGGDVAVGVDADVPGADLLRVGVDVRAPRAVLHALLRQYQSNNLAYDFIQTRFELVYCTPVKSSSCKLSAC